MESVVSKGEETKKAPEPSASSSSSSSSVFSEDTFNAQEFLIFLSREPDVSELRKSDPFLTLPEANNAQMKINLRGELKTISGKNLFMLYFSGADSREGDNKSKVKTKRIAIKQQIHSMMQDCIKSSVVPVIAVAEKSHNKSWLLNDQYANTLKLANTTTVGKGAYFEHLLTTGITGSALTKVAEARQGDFSATEMEGYSADPNAFKGKGMRRYGGDVTVARQHTDGSHLIEVIQAKDYLDARAGHKLGSGQLTGLSNIGKKKSVEQPPPMAHVGTVVLNSAGTDSYKKIQEEAYVNPASTPHQSQRVVFIDTSGETPSYYASDYDYEKMERYPTPRKQREKK